MATWRLDIVNQSAYVWYCSCSDVGLHLTTAGPTALFHRPSVTTLAESILLLFYDIECDWTQGLTNTRLVG